MNQALWYEHINLLLVRQLANDIRRSVSITNAEVEWLWLTGVKQG